MYKPTLESPIYGEESLFVDDFLTEKEEKRFIKEVEKIIRKSPEYDRWIRFVHGSLGSGFVCYLTGHISDECNIELHHYPITLFNYVQIAMYNLDNYTSFDLAKQVMFWHFDKPKIFLNHFLSRQSLHTNLVQSPKLYSNYQKLLGCFPKLVLLLEL
ncbi:MAG TPA: hypothetical protein P5513_07045 [Candidatus Diapherotrites archaeon]|nr:hypothetical protein [Candidatus Diapherotrites archaeon]